jgi:Protein of unknown function (DUF3285)
MQRIGVIRLSEFSSNQIIIAIMSDTPIDNPIAESPTVIEIPPTPEELKTKFVKYAMRNMVKKGGKSLQHFALSAIGLLTLFVGLAYLTR